MQTTKAHSALSDQLCLHLSHGVIKSRIWAFAYIEDSDQLALGISLVLSDTLMSA